MVDHILEFPRLAVSDVNCLGYYSNCFGGIMTHGTILILKSLLNFHVYWDI